MKNPIIAIALLVSIVSGVTFASGFKCESVRKSDGYNVKLFNHVAPEGGTRTPAAMVISHEDEGTLLVRTASEIRKSNRANTVQYVVAGSKRLAAEKAILQIRFKEGKEVLEAGEVAQGQLILVSDSNRDVIELDCERYLKNQ